ncbi:MAG: DEAD/DEAH box helicase [Deltaproteobacteria bacterium]|nr:DEAD/DEAH box helicase [Deltaproteobacteria bacterium]
MTPDCRVVRAEVRTTETFDALFLVAETGQGTALLRAMRDGLGLDGTGLRRSAEGVRVPAAIAWRLDELGSGVQMNWTPEARRFVENRRHVASVHSEVFANLLRIRREGAGLAERMVADSASLDVLDQHQVVNVAAMTLPDSPGLCVFDEQGAGKTVTFIFAFDLLVERDEADLAVIVAPKSMIGEWPKDLGRFRGDIYRTVVLTGTAREKRRLLAESADVLVTNFETAVTMEPELRALMRARPGRTVLAIDESFFIKSLDAKRTRALRRLREWAGRAYVLCGTPAPNSPSDLVQQFSLVDFGYCFKDVELPIERELAAPVVQSAIEKRGLYLRHLKREVLPDLPVKRFQRVIVPMAEEQGRLYRAHLDRLVAEVEAVDDSGFIRQRTSFLARRAALLQICSNPSGVSETYGETPAKLEALDSLVKQLVRREREKVVIWSFYTASVAAIAGRYARYGVVRYDGSVPDVVARREAVRRFQEDDDTMVFVANPAAAGAGLTLHRARVAIYESLSNQAAHYLQSLDRIHRRGQERDVEYVVLLCDDTLEVSEYDRLVQKEQAAQDLLGDNVEAPLTRETFLTDVRKAAALLNTVEAGECPG